MNKYPTLLSSCGFALFCWLAVAQASRNADESPDRNIALHLPIQAEKMLPLADAVQLDLNDSSLEQYKVRTAIYWHDYQQGIKLGRLGIYLAPPHFAAWAMHKHNFIPLVRLNQPLSYVIATDRTDRSLFEINDLVNKPICSSKPLNLDYLLIISTFENSVMTAIPTTVNSVVSEMYDSETDCKAFSVSDHALQDMAHQGISKFIRLMQSPNMNNYVVISHPAISEHHRSAIKDYFLKETTERLLKPMADQFSHNGSWVRAKKDDYPKTYYTQLVKYWGE